jgi:phage/plasmid-like protein (TIGR03299 family)
MGHNLFKERMAFVGNVPWHGLGVPVPPDIGSHAMCEAAGLDWSVAKAPAPGARLVDDRKKQYDRYLILREPVEDEREHVALGMVGAGYEPLQNLEAFKFFEPLIETGFAEFHTAGALGNGERVWVLARLTDPIVVGQDDVIDRYLLLSNSHDGSGAVSVRFTPIRVVCQNTLNLAVKPGGKSAYSIRHTRHIQKHMEKAQAEQLRAVVDRVFNDAADLFARMALKRVDASERYKILQVLFPRPPAPSSGPLRSRRRRPLPERWRRIEHVLADDLVTPRETANTAWGLYNAITRDEDYRATRELGDDARLRRVWFGSGQDLKIKTLEYFRNYLKAA